MRMQCSKLNAHLFKLHVIESPSCFCGHNIEDSEHYLLYCPLYLVPRIKMIQTLQTCININDLHVDTLLYGSSDCDYRTNVHIFEAVHDFINECDRL